MNDALAALGTGGIATASKAVTPKGEVSPAGAGEEGVATFHTELASRLDQSRDARRDSPAPADSPETSVSDAPSPPSPPSEHAVSTGDAGDRGGEKASEAAEASSDSPPSPDAAMQAALLAQARGEGLLPAVRDDTKGGGGDSAVSEAQAEPMAPGTGGQMSSAAFDQGMKTCAPVADAAAAGQMLPPGSQGEAVSSSRKTSVMSLIGGQGKVSSLHAETGKMDFVSRFASGQGEAGGQSGASTGSGAQTPAWSSLFAQTQGEGGGADKDLLKLLAGADVAAPKPLLVPSSAEVPLRAPPPSGTVQLAVESPVRSPAFAQELGDRLVWMSSGRQGQHVADISLNPANLGPVEVKLSVSGGQANAQFFSPHPQVREAIEAAMPKLREMLAEAGVALGQTHVQDQSLSREQAFSGQAPRHDGDGRVRGADEGEKVMQMPVRRAGLGMVDLYA